MPNRKQNSCVYSCSSQNTKQFCSFTWYIVRCCYRFIYSQSLDAPLSQCKSASLQFNRLNAWSHPNVKTSRHFCYLQREREKQLHNHYVYLDQRTVSNKSRAERATSQIICVCLSVCTCAVLEIETRDVTKKLVAFFARMHVHAGMQAKTQQRASACMAPLSEPWFL